ncbi:MAG: RidA family protein [Methyloceanibacter sp.]
MRFEYIHAEGQFKGDVPLSPALKVGKLIFVSGTPAFDASGKIAAGGFTAQMRQAMENVAGTLRGSGAGWHRVAKVNVMLTRREDFAEMNRIYSAYFLGGNYPARTTAVLLSLPQPEFLVEIECEAVLE